MAWLGLRKTTKDRPKAAWGSRRAIVAHVALAIWLPGCATASWWQVNIALSGDSIGWIYSVMWPFFAVFGTVFWWTLVHDDPDTVGGRGLRRLQAAAASQGDEDAETVSSDDLIAMAEEEDPALAEYNAYLAELARSDRPKSWMRR